MSCPFESIEISQINKLMQIVFCVVMVIVISGCKSTDPVSDRPWNDPKNWERRWDHPPSGVIKIE